MFQSCQKWSGNYNTFEFMSVVTTSLNYWTKAIAMSSYYRFPFEPVNYQGRRSLCVDSGTQGGIPRWVLPGNLLTFQIIPQAHKTSKVSRIISLWIWAKEDWHEISQFSPKSLHKLSSSAHLETYFHFSVLRLVPLRKKDPYILYKRRPYSMYKSVCARIKCMNSRH